MNGERAIVAVRSELAKESVDFDKVAHDEAVKLHGERDPLASHGGDHKSTDRLDQDDNIILKEQGTSAAYLAARIKRDFPEIAEQLAAGKFRSVRAAAKAAGIVQDPTVIEQLWKLWSKATDSERAEFRIKINEEP